MGENITTVPKLKIMHVFNILFFENKTYKAVAELAETDIAIKNCFIKYSTTHCAQ